MQSGVGSISSLKHGGAATISGGSLAPEGTPHVSAASVYDEQSIGPSTRQICTRYCSTMTNMIQLCTNFYEARVLIVNTRPDQIRSGLDLVAQARGRGHHLRRQPRPGRYA